MAPPQAQACATPRENRNLDLRRDFHKRLDRTSISATTIFNGAFAGMLTGQMPLILFKLKRVLYWGDADQRMDFTTMDDTPAFTASAAGEGSCSGKGGSWRGLRRFPQPWRCRPVHRHQSGAG
jgi:hypothetical protein